MKDNIISRIKKLIALSKSDNCEEASSAAQKASDLLLKYNISRKDVEKKDFHVVEDFIEEKLKVRIWKTILLGAISSLNLCNIVINTDYREKKTNLNIVGKEQNVIVTKELYKYLVDTIDRISKSKSNMYNSKDSFKKGMSVRISERLSLIKKERFKSSVETYSNIDRALIVAEYKNASIANNNFIDDNYGNIGIKKTRIKAYESSFNNGLKAGNEINLNSQIKQKKALLEI